MIRRLLLVAAASLALAACSDPEGTNGGGGGNNAPITGGGGMGSSPISGGALGSLTPQQLAAAKADWAQNFQASGRDRVFFGTDSISIDGPAQGVLTQQAEWLRRNPGVRFMVEGHADERGTREYNLALGARRAQAARDYLVSLGIAENRLETVSYGKERPDSLGNNDSVWARNRRGVSVPTS
ncbi:peptidoglycan-associated lipoprotein Pal [Lacibacterium aquatile]|uniref:Peptidoglycan-associated lipoprotein n=1 Tax=Lacibacterium aquatile TaxID=1168082 RepID=A0ABW5DUY5_9PROT